MFEVELVEEVEGGALSSGKLLRGQDIQNWRALGAEARALEGSGKEGVGVISRSAVGSSLEKQDVRRQVLIGTAQTVGDP